MVYLIGLMFRNDPDDPDSQWILRLMLAEKETEENELLSSLLSFLAGRKDPKIISFNGYRFDLPFLEARLKNAGYSENEIPSCLTTDSGFDIYRLISPYKKLLGLPNMKQKTIELFLGINREDKYNGGELIQVFHAFAASGNPTMKELLLSHNHDDVLGMCEILPILHYVFLFSKEWNYTRISLESAELAVDPTDPCSVPKELILNFNLSFPIPSECCLSSNGISVSAHDLRGEMHIPVESGTMYHFFEDYKNYFYVPSMDTAIHKSVAQFMDAEDKVKAKASNCYVKKEGFFVPEKEKIFEPVFKKGCKEKCTYFELTEENLRSERMQDYLRSMLGEFKQVTLGSA